jgi:hypothetical protein
MGIGDKSPWRRKETRTKLRLYELIFLSAQNSKFVRTLFEICPYEFSFFISPQHDKEVVDVSSLSWSEYFLIMRLKVPYVFSTSSSSIYMTMTTLRRNYDTLASWLYKNCVFTMWRVRRSYETETS